MGTMGRKVFDKKRPLHCLHRAQFQFLQQAASPWFANCYLNKVSRFCSSAFVGLCLQWHGSSDSEGTPSTEQGKQLKIPT